MKAALYARVSTTQHGQDVGLQLSELRRVATQREWLSYEYIDDGVSGTLRQRPALDRMMHDVRSGHLQIVAVWRFDRFARSTAHLIEAMEEFRSLKVDFVSLRDQVDTSTPFGRAMFTITAAIAELERELTVERIRAGIAEAKANGVHCGRPPVPFSDDQVQAAIALQEQGWGVRRIAKTLGVSKSVLHRKLDGLSADGGEDDE